MPGLAETLLDGCRESCLAVDLVVSGAWQSREPIEACDPSSGQPGRSPDLRGMCVRWDGAVIGPPGMVAVLYAESGDVLVWSRTRKGHDPALPLTLSVAPWPRSPARYRFDLLSRGAIGRH